MSSSKPDLTITDSIWGLSVSFKGKLSSNSNLIFMKCFPYSPALPPFIVLTRYLTS